jgi:hypothetical protein
MTNYRMQYGRSTPPPLPNALRHNGRTIVDMKYRMFFIGTIWDSAAPLRSARQELERGLGGALTDAHLNKVFSQYFRPTTSKATAALTDAAAVLPQDWPPTVSQADIEQHVANLLAATADPRIPQETDFANFVAVFVLPPGTILQGEAGEEEANSLRGLAAFHSWCNVAGPPQRTVRYAVAVWSDGQNGCAKPGWQPWQNTCAALYHELAEVRTNPDVGRDPPYQGWFAVIPPDHPMAELADLPIIWGGSRPYAMMQVVQLANSATAPIQFMWSNLKQAPWDPDTSLSDPNDLGRVPPFDPPRPP